MCAYNRYEEALSRYKESLEVKRRVAEWQRNKKEDVDGADIATMMHMIGQTLGRLNHHDEAEEQYRKAQLMWEATHEQPTTAYRRAEGLS